MESGGQSRSDREYLRVRNKMGPSYFWKSLLGSTVLKPSDSLQCLAYEGA